MAWSGATTARPRVDGLPPGEGIFIPCSFWLADNLILLGRRDDARRLFERVLSLRNDVGLLSEEYDVGTNRLLGNFPQAFSHVALINTAYLLTSKTKYKRHETGRLAPESHDDDVVTKDRREMKISCQDSLKAALPKIQTFQCQNDLSIRLSQYLPLIQA